VNKHVREAIEYAEKHGWTIRLPKGHSYGALLAPDGRTRKSVWSTPRNPDNHARDIERLVDRVAEEMGDAS
jgi:hypothetical protein